MTPLILSMPNELSSRSNSNAVLDDDCDETNNESIDGNNTGHCINNNNSLGTTNNDGKSRLLNGNDNILTNDIEKIDMGRISTHIKNDEQDSLSQNDDIFGETIDD